MNDTTTTLHPLSGYRFNMLADAAMDMLVQCTPSACKLWLVMCKARRWGDDRIRHSVAALTAAAGMSKPTVLRSVKELRDAGLLRYEACRNRTTDYEVIGVLPRGRRPEPGSARDVHIRRCLQSLPTVDNPVDNPVDNVPSGVPAGGAPEVPVVKKFNRSSAAGVKKVDLIQRELPTKRKEVGCCSSNPSTARVNSEQGNDLLPDPFSEWRRRRVAHGRFLAEQDTEDTAGTMTAEDAIAGVHREVHRLWMGGDTVGEILEKFLVPIHAVEVAYSPEAVPGALGGDWQPFAADRAPSARFSAMLGAPDGSDYVRSVWDRVRQAAVWRELTPRVVRAAVQAVGPADEVPADRMVVELWSQVKAQRLSVRTVINEATGTPVEEASEQ